MIRVGLFGPYGFRFLNNVYLSDLNKNNFWGDKTPTKFSFIQQLFGKTQPYVQPKTWTQIWEKQVLRKDNKVTIL